jgi:hypothetical protein
MRQLQRRLCINRMEYFFHRKSFRRESLNYNPQFGSNEPEPLFQHISGFRTNDPCGDQSMTTAISVDNTKSCFFGPAIDSDNSHQKNSLLQNRTAAEIR